MFLAWLRTARWDRERQDFLMVSMVQDVDRAGIKH